MKSLVELGLISRGKGRMGESISFKGKIREYGKSVFKELSLKKKKRGIEEWKLKVRRGEKI